MRVVGSNPQLDKPFGFVHWVSLGLYWDLLPDLWVQEAVQRAIRNYTKIHIVNKFCLDDWEILNL